MSGYWNIGITPYAIGGMGWGDGPGDNSGVGDFGESLFSDWGASDGFYNPGNPPTAFDQYASQAAADGSTPVDGVEVTAAQSGQDNSSATVVTASIQQQFCARDLAWLSDSAKLVMNAQAAQQTLLNSIPNALTLENSQATVEAAWNDFYDASYAVMNDCSESVANSNLTNARDVIDESYEKNQVPTANYPQF